MAEVRAKSAGFFPAVGGAVPGSNAAVSRPRGTAGRPDEAPARDAAKGPAERPDTNVTIDEAVRDFARIKRAVDAAPEADRADRVAELRGRVADGTYAVDAGALADRILETELP